MALSLIPISLLAKLLIPRYDVSAVHFLGGLELSISKLATRSQPPVTNITFKSIRCNVNGLNNSIPKIERGEDKEKLEKITR